VNYNSPFEQFKPAKWFKLLSVRFITESLAAASTTRHVTYYSGTNFLNYCVRITTLLLHNDLDEISHVKILY